MILLFGKCCSTSPKNITDKGTSKWDYDLLA